MAPPAGTPIAPAHKRHTRKLKSKTGGSEEQTVVLKSLISFFIIPKI
jgi:hypothetical protein